MPVVVVAEIFGLLLLAGVFALGCLVVALGIKRTVAALRRKPGQPV